MITNIPYSIRPNFIYLIYSIKRRLDEEARRVCSEFAQAEERAHYQGQTEKADADSDAEPGAKSRLEHDSAIPRRQTLYGLPYVQGTIHNGGRRG